MPNTLASGEVRVGQLYVAGAPDDEPTQSAALIFDERHGATLLVPYVRGESQFRATEKWFRSSSTPPCVVFADDKGVVTLVGVRWHRQSGSTMATGRLVAAVAIFGQPTHIKADYKVAKLRSSIDGLSGFSDFRPVRYDFPGPGEQVTLAFDESELRSWRSAGFTYSLKPHVTWSGTEGHQFEAQSTASLVTSKARGATPREHLRAQWAIRDLLLFAHGQKLAWRSHQVVDNQFPLLTLDGKTHGPDPAETHFAGTLREHSWPEPSSTGLAFPALSLRSVGTRGLKKWTDLYSNELFRRAVEPAAEVINGAASFLEPQLMMLASSLDYFGYFRFRDQRRRPMHESILKCLHDPGLDWPEVGSRSGIASAITKLNNDLKHPDRERRPSGEELACMVTLATVIARAQPLDLLRTNAETRRSFLSSREAHRATEIFQQCGIRIADDGSLLPT
jgi:hypothetical protein